LTHGGHSSGKVNVCFAVFSLADVLFECRTLAWEAVSAPTATFPEDNLALAWPWSELVYYAGSKELGDIQTM
jgi:hypothetical protein